MSADLSRVRFDAFNDWAELGLQQGRVLLDADFNELVDIVDRRLRAGAADLGSSGPAPGDAGVAVVPRTTPDGFRVTASADALTIGVGRMYVDGILVENHGTGAAGFSPLLAETVLADPVPYDAQPYWPTPDPLPSGGTYLAYLDVWQREVTPLQDPSLIEQAVGVDTTTRVQAVWQVRLLDPSGTGLGPDVTCDTPDSGVPGWQDLIAPSAGRLTTGTVRVDQSLDPCQLPPTGGYRGVENQLYRVQIHDPGPLGTATFVWSRDNASVATAVTDVLSSTMLRVASLGRDSVLRIATGDWVEILDDHREFNQSSGELRKVTVDEAARTLTFTPALPADLMPTGTGTDTASGRHLRVVRWDQKGKVSLADGTLLVDLDAVGSTGAIPTPADGSQVVLENGVVVSFGAATAGGALRAGDHWEFAARTAGTWLEPLAAAPPRGIHHHYARLALVTLPTGQTDCRTLWPPPPGAGDEGCACTVCVTPQSHASGAMTMQQAVDVVRLTGGTVCVTAGQYRLREPVKLIDAASVRIHGQGLRTIIVAEQGGFELLGCVDCRVEDLTLISSGLAPPVAAFAVARVALGNLIVLALGQAKGTQQPSAAIEIAGLAAFVTVSDCLLIAQVGIGGGRYAPSYLPSTAAGKAGPAFLSWLLAVDLRICDNVLLCQAEGIDMTGLLVAYALGARISGNTVLGCEGWGIGATGVMLLGGAMLIERNGLNVLGHGIITGPSGARVLGNDIGAMRIMRVSGRKPVSFGSVVKGGLASGPIPAAGNIGQVGVAVVEIALQATGGFATIDGNSISGMSGLAVLGLEAAGTFRVDRNVVGGCGGGIALLALGSDVGIAGNQILNLVAPAVGGLAGIEVLGASGLLAVDNVIDGLDPEGQTGATRVGVRAIGCAVVNISRNQVRQVSTATDNAPAFGIDVAAPFLAATIAHNQVRPGAATSDATLFDSPWTAVRVEGSSKAMADHLPSLRFLLPLARGTGTLGLVGSRGFVLPAADQSACVVIDGNELSGSGASPPPVVLVAALGDAQFSTNHIDNAASDQGAAALIVGQTVIAQGNRVVGGDPSIEIDAATQFAAVGNITSAGINAGGPLASPWDVLNPVG
jgi:Family of unknown function (DUF6519)